MNRSVIVELIYNAALLLSLGLLYDTLVPRSRGGRRWLDQILTGLVVGLMGMAVMVNPWRLSTGIVFDTRSVLLSVAGLFFGTVPAVVSILMTGSLRVYQGGAGAVPGVCVIITTSLIGVLWRRLRRTTLAEIGGLELYLFGLIVHLDMLLCMLTLPRQVAFDVLSKISIPVLLIYPVGTALLGKIMAGRLAHRRAERALRESEERFRRMAERISDVVLVLDKEWVPTYASPSIRTVFGYEPEEVVGRPLQQWNIASESLARIREAQGRVQASDAIETVEISIRRKDRRMVDVEASGTPIMHGGVFSGIQVMLRDVTDRKRAEREVRDSERRYRTLLQAVQTGVVIHDSDTAIIDANEKALEILNLRLEDIRGRKSDDSGWTFFNEQEGRMSVSEYPVNVALSTCRPVGGLVMGVLRPETGERVWVLVSAQPVLAADGSIAQVVVNFMDITGLRKAEQSLRESEEHLASLFTNMAEGLALHELVLDESERPVDYRIVDVNPRYESIVNRSRDQTLGRLSTEVYGTSEPPFLSEFSEVALHGVTRRMEVYFQPLGKHFEISAAPWGDRGFATIFSDISERKRTEEQLRQAQKMEAVGQLAGGVAHDFNNLLQVINGFTEMAMEDLGPSHPIYGTLNDVAQAGQRAARLVGQLLAFSRRQVIKPENLDLNTVIASMLNMVGRVLGEHIRIEFVPGRPLGTVWADRGQMEQVLMNLGVNARDAMPEGGHLKIETHNIVMNAAYCRAHAWARPGSFVQLTVSDTGCGMDAETIDHIFDPFFTTKEIGKGTGLGLATVYGIIRQHEGMIRVSSEPGHGTVFRLYLPVVEGPPTAFEAPPETPLRRGTETVLVAEDEEKVRDLTRRVLENAGYIVLTAESGEDALRICREHGETIDLVLLDVVMPRMGGKAAYQKIKSLFPRMRFLFASGYSADALHTNFVLDEKIELIEKPFDPKHLLARMRSILDRP